MPKLEKRLSERSPVRLRVDCRPLDPSDLRNILDGQGYEELSFDSLALQRPRSGMMPARIKDLSDTGLCMESALPLGLGDATALDLHLPHESTALKVLAEVVWCKPAEGPQGQHACGLRIAALAEDGRRRLKQFLLQQPLVTV